MTSDRLHCTGRVSHVVIRRKAANWSSDPHLNVFLVDPINSPVIFPDFFQMKGVQMRIPIQKNTFNSFVIRTLRSYQVEGNPTFLCKEYNQDQNWAKLIFKLNDVPKPIFDYSTYFIDKIQ